jgi:hypothetical protein
MLSLLQIIIDVLLICAVIAIPVWLREKARSFVQKELQLHKANLDRDLEEYKNDVQRETKRNEIVFTKLREEQAEIFKTMYEKVATLHHQMWSVTMSWPSEKEVFDAKMQTFSSTLENLWNFLSTRKIFLPASLDNAITQFYFNSVSAVSDFRSLRFTEDIRQQVQERKEASALRDECEVVKTEIEKQFRALLGVEEV